MADEIVNDYDAFDKASNTEKSVVFYEFKLFVTGINPNSLKAVRNMKNICRNYLNEKDYKLEVIDVYQNAEMARGEDIVATPTLIKKSPAPVCKLVGDLSDTNKVLNLLGINKNINS